MKETAEQNENRKMNPMALARRAGLDGFILALMGMILLAWLWPSFGEKGSLVPFAALASYGVSFIFFSYGLRLDPEKMKAGLKNWPLHLVVHVTTFLLFPLLVIAARLVFENDQNHLLWLGIFFLASLPSTVSSSVVMVSIAGGNMPAAIFNASISSLMGVFITPFWMSTVMQGSHDGNGLGAVMIKLVVQVIVPVIAGMIMHRRWGAFAERHKKQLKYFDQTVILLIVYTSFCESFAKKMFAGYTISHILLLSAAMIALFLLVFGIVKLVSRLLHFNRADTITAVFCGSKKSLIHGTVMSKVLFPGSDMVGIILLPLMLYHALQLMTASIIAQSMARKDPFQDR